MKGKSLTVRFIMLAGLLAIAVLALYRQPLKLGMDLEGGHSLTFKVDTGGSRSQLDDVIDTLKERVDPQGVMNLEWRASGADRIEVRMPVGSARAREAQLEYLKALEALTERNITPAFIRQVVAAKPEDREALIAGKVGAEGRRADLLRQATRLADQAAAEQAKIAAPLNKLKAELAELRLADEPSIEAIDAKQAEIDALTEVRDVARGTYRQTVRELRNTNIRPNRLAAFLKLYDPPKVARQMKPADVAERKAKFDEQLDKLREDYPRAADEITEVADLYKRWADIRGRLDDPEDLIRLIRKAGVLEFRIAPKLKGGTVTVDPQELHRYREELTERGPDAARNRGADFQWFKIRDPKEVEKLGGLIVEEWAADQYILLSNRPDSRLLQTKDGPQWTLTEAKPRFDADKDGWVVDFRLDPRGGRLFADLTGNHVQENMAILLDDEVYSAPNILQRIKDKGVITGKFTRDDVRDLCRTLTAGALRAKVNPTPIAMDSIGPTLGQANIDRGWRAGWIGLIGVVVFMLIYYWFAGLVADFALAVNLLLILAAMATFNVIFTLPGIAGLILTIGIAVDANVLIFERLREERRTRADMYTAIGNAYSRAFTAIIDGNATTFLVCIILYWVGTQEIKGFATTLGIGIAFSLFTSLLVTRWIFYLVHPAKWNTSMAGLVGTPSINWFAKRRIFWVVSAALIVAGVVSIVQRRSTILGIEFSKGTRAVFRLNDDALIDGKLPDDFLVEQKVQSVAAELDIARMVGQGVQVNELRTETRVADFIQTYDATANGGNGDGVVSAAEWEAQGRDPEAFAMLDADGDGSLGSAELAATLPEPRYQVTSSEPDYEQVRRVIDTAFRGQLSSLTKLDFTLLADEPIGGLNLSAGPNGVLELTEQLLDENPTAGGEFREEIADNIGGVLMAFRLNDPEQAMTAAELTQRLRNTRLQAGRDDVQVVQTRILPLTAGGGANRFVQFGVIVRSDDVTPDSEAWDDFTRAERDLLVDALNSERALESLANFDAAMTAKATQRAIIAIILSWLGIIGYLWLRFGSARWGLAAVLCLIHDTLIVVGLVGICGLVAHTAIGKALLIDSFKIDLAIIAAVLTVIGYSVNDTIVVFDRIRENRKKSVTLSPVILNRSINQTLARTLLTSCTTLIVVVVMYIWGGDGIHGFSFTLLAGVLFGTYSSIAIASPLLLGFKEALVAKATMPAKGK